MKKLNSTELYTLFNQTRQEEITRAVKPFVNDLFPGTYALTFRMNVRELTIINLSGNISYYESEPKPDSVVKLELALFERLKKLKFRGMFDEEFCVTPNSTFTAPPVFTYGDDHVPLSLECYSGGESTQQFTIHADGTGIDIKTWQYGLNTGHLGISHEDDKTTLEVWKDSSALAGDPSLSAVLFRYKLVTVQRTLEQVERLEYVQKNYQYNLPVLHKWCNHYGIRLFNPSLCFEALLATGDFVEVTVLDSTSYNIVHKDAL